MALTPEQSTTLKDDIAIQVAPASGTAIEGLDPTSSDEAFAIALWYNEDSNPAFIVWRTNVPVSEMKTATVWTEYIGRSVGERDAYQFMLSDGMIDSSDTNIQQGIQDIFSGPTGAVSRSQLIAVSKRTANKIEGLLSTGTGSDAVPATMSFEGTINYRDVLNSNNA